ncbi:hypothetical protein FIBSPDRAFT_1041749 [Athelia psychrophila]|uniref:Uncharacterized protein n=1 Tax=Athelia psychrophila TaxID=1759441 RepID=A0A166NFF0_9AGAM|nr:hypothetical protein FIBSPDRAFT_1041749 [Fibularhizoctonia sp. CBS 109695]
MGDQVPLLEYSSHLTWHSQPTQISSDDDEPKAQTKAGAEPDEEPEYESRALAWLTLSASIVVAVAFMIAGVALSRSKNKVAGSATVHSVIPIISSSQGIYNYSREVLSAVFTIIATVATEAVGSVHSTALRSTLIDEYRHLLRTSDPNTPLPPNAKHRFEFNTNSRLFAASNKPGWANPNGRLMNALMALLLVVSYAASALIVTELQTWEGPDLSTATYGIGLSAPPIVVFGLSLFLQGVISILGTYGCGPYWLDNTDMLATTKRQIDDNVIVPRPHRCMRNVLQGQSTTPDALKPSARQPSAWSANRTVKKAVIVVWGLIPVYTAWGAIIYTLSIYADNWISKSGKIYTVGIGTLQLSEFSWSFLPNANSQSFGVAFLTNHAKEEASLPSVAWPSTFLVFMAIQSGLTLALHYCEAIINTTRDEDVWRQAVGYWGVSTLGQGFMRGLFVGTLGSWRSVFILVTKFLCHWLFAQSFQVNGVFAQSFSVSGVYVGTYFTGITALARCAQIWYLSVILVGVATITTIIAKYKPHGPQPAAYGHFQTLADLIDEWYPVVYWGHKSDEYGVCHAGTHYEPLTTPINMKRKYAGELDQTLLSTANLQSQ